MKRGIEQWTYNLSKQLQKDKTNKVIIYTWDSKNPLKWQNFDSEVKIRKVPYIRYFRGILVTLLYKIWLFIDKPNKKILSFLWFCESSIVDKKNDIIIFHNPYNQMPSRYEFSKKFISSQTSVILD